VTGIKVASKVILFCSSIQQFKLENDTKQFLNLWSGIGIGVIGCTDRTGLPAGWYDWHWQCYRNRAAGGTFGGVVGVFETVLAASLSASVTAASAPSMASFIAGDPAACSSRIVPAREKAKV
jgi:hypothetical protein